jgi:hypothetical protein
VSRRPGANRLADASHRKRALRDGIPMRGANPIREPGAHGEFDGVLGMWRSFARASLGFRGSSRKLRLARKCNRSGSRSSEAP